VADPVLPGDPFPRRVLRRGRHIPGRGPDDGDEVDIGFRVPEVTDDPERFDVPVLLVAGLEVDGVDVHRCFLFASQIATATVAKKRSITAIE
jgi:hypothetical protein